MNSLTLLFPRSIYIKGIKVTLALIKPCDVGACGPCDTLFSISELNFAKFVDTYGKVLKASHTTGWALTMTKNCFYPTQMNTWLIVTRRNTVHC
ncbi:hypothetical protein Ptr902_01432 [Pyrenophora tritici-repentis]|nr:hypothetical protein PtrV1_01464 [Pyrenophora tritici-repentis]KAI0575153.1 hypothetical protein Alg215_08192 [Pyrenophora tritici-repentis]KAI0585951.1 hypothetical protein Alg130_04484 [Pyrenophora tritici-repentis]KAI0609316.1 hypothetical protein TUN205_06426 [Pyrenophora tritici-repentis]KAI0623259.1 hypothetical protein TUN199_04723 [Pyrenophora tritici-repentis]